MPTGRAQTAPVRIIRPGDRGPEVDDVQQRLTSLGFRIDAYELDGWFGPSTESAVCQFQRRRGIPSDGLVGPDTWGNLVEAGYSLGDRTLYLRYPPSRGDDVAALQGALNALGFEAGKEDGIFGERTDRAVREFQRNVGREADGIVGPETLADIQRLRRPAPGPSRALVREAEALHTMRAPLVGAVIAIDPGHGPEEPGASGPGGTVEAEAAYRLATALADELAARGAKPALLREADSDPPASARTKLANELGAAVCVAVHTNHGDPTAEGATCFYFGTEGTHSPAGMRLAELILASLTSGLDLVDGRIHPLAIAILRETRMPAVQVEPCFITNPHEERLLRDDGFLHRVAAAIAEGIARFLGATQQRAEERPAG